jgi:hypothetical protein
MKQTLIAVCLACTACSGGSKPMMSTTANIDPVPMNEQAPRPAPAEPTDRVAPVEAVEPTQPAAPDPAQVKAKLLAAEMTAYANAKPVFDKYCAKCHSKDGSKQSVGKRKHFDMTTYPFGGHHAMEVHDEVREVLGLTGKKPTMPADKKGAVQGAELDLVKAWADAFEASHEGGAHEGQGHHGGGNEH